jgi:uncharacterized repeat protein (TIGR01451 family)
MNNQLLFAILVSVPLLLSHPVVSDAGTTDRVSVGTGRAQGNGGSFDAALSADGRFVAFDSSATNLVAGDTNAQSDVFVRDRQSGRTTRVSVGNDGVQGNFDSSSPVLSADGRFVVFESTATNLVPEDTNGQSDVFVHDRQRGRTTRVSVGNGGVQGNLDSSSAAVSADGRFVAFVSSATNLVAGDTNAQRDVFVHDRQSGRTTRVSVANGGVQGNFDSSSPALSADGRFVVFESTATNLVPEDTNAQSDVFVHDRQTGQTTRASVGNGGVQGNLGSSSAAVSADGRFVVFVSTATNLVAGDTNAQSDVFVRDRQTGRTTRVSVGTGNVQGNGDSFNAALSADGRFVAFVSSATNLVAEDNNAQSDVFAHDRHTGRTTRVSVRAGGAQANFGSGAPALSADGRFAVFESTATNLVPGDTNAQSDVFVRDRFLDRGRTADLALLSATDLPDPIKRGNAITYAFTLINQGPNAATAATLVDGLSSQLIVNTVSSSQGTCSKANLVVCRLGNLAKGAKATVTVTAKVRSTAAAGMLQSTVSINANPHDPKPGNNRKVLQTEVTP